jgi:UDP-GlcNAc:undecaprenyl-phosphate GlcNAc-1-phosphate transferase
LPYLLPILKPWGISLISALILVPLLRFIAIKTHFVDMPSNRKVHARPLALLGGVGIYLSFALAVALSSTLGLSILGIVTGAGLLMILGLIDDRYGMNPWIKILGQATAAAIVIACGVSVQFLDLPYLNVAFTLLWMVGITNSFNLLDNMDGLSAGVAFISAVAFAAITARFLFLGREQVEALVIAAALSGACLGFLRYNLYRASIFMGDAGSMVLGFILASISALGSWHSATITTSVLIPVLILAYPIFDTTLVTLLRLLRGVPFYRGGKDHSSHRLVNLGLSKLEAVLLIYLFCLTHALAAFLVSSVTFRLALMAFFMSGCTLFIFGMVLRKAPLDDR